MALITVRPTEFDHRIAGAIADHADPRIEQAAGIVTWAADEHVVVAAAAIAWLLTRQAAEPGRRLGTHHLACALATAVLPPLLKSFVDQERPDRRTIVGHWRGIPFSGKSGDAFPSGHALHVGALASAATLLPPPVRNLAWSVGATLAATRLVLLAHWFTDVLAGLGLGIGVERALRRWTRPTPLGPARRASR